MGDGAGEDSGNCESRNRKLLRFLCEFLGKSGTSNTSCMSKIEKGL